jgi:peptidylprolyl isomerase
VAKMKVRRKIPARLSLAALALVSLTLTPFVASCAADPVPRQTRAPNGRSHDPWLDGDECSDDSLDDHAVRVEDVIIGSGPPVDKGDTVRVDYVASLASGAVIHRSRTSGPPVEIVIGSTKMICGFQQGLPGMRPGGQRRVSVPSRLAFGEAGKPGEVAPQSDLVFVIDLYLPADAPEGKGPRPANPICPRRGR